MNKTALSLSCLLSCLAVSTNTLANSADIGVSNETVEASYRHGITNGVSAVGSWLHAEHDINVISAGLYGGGRRGDAGAFVGAKAFWVDASGPDGQGIALGGAVAYELIPKLTIELNAHFAPSSTSYKDIEKYEEWGTRLTLQILPVANIYVGYRDIDIDVSTGRGHSEEFDLVRGGYAGLTLYFQ